MIRWLDFNDTWLAAEWGILPISGSHFDGCRWLGRTARASGGQGPTMGNVLQAMVQAHEIQGCLALENSFNKLDWITCGW